MAVVLNDDDLLLAVHAVQCASDLVVSGSAPDYDAFVPDRDGVLAPISELVYDDAALQVGEAAVGTGIEGAIRFVVSVYLIQGLSSVPHEKTKPTNK